MRPFDRSAPPASSGIVRFSDPTTLVCVALALAVIVLSMRIISIW